MHTAIYPGSFDPIHNGHLDVIMRATRLCDVVIVAVATNLEKAALFSPEERVEMIRDATRGIPEVEVVAFHGLLVKFAQERGAQAIIRGLRAVSDFEYELQMGLMNRQLCDELETVFLMPRQESIFLSSRTIKAVADVDGDISGFVPPDVEKKLMQRIHQP